MIRRPLLLVLPCLSAFALDSMVLAGEPLRDSALACPELCARITVPAGEPSSVRTVGSSPPDFDPRVHDLFSVYCDALQDRSLLGLVYEGEVASDDNYARILKEAKEIEVEIEIEQGAGELGEIEYTRDDYLKIPREINPFEDWIRSWSGAEKPLETSHSRLECKNVRLVCFGNELRIGSEHCVQPDEDMRRAESRPGFLAQGDRGSRVAPSCGASTAGPCRIEPRDRVQGPDCP